MALGAVGFLGALALLPGCFVDSGSSSCGVGAIHASWELRSATGQIVECSAGSMVEMRVDTDAMTIKFPCTDHEGTSPGVDPLVSHVVSLRLLDAHNQEVAFVDPMNVFVDCGQIADTPPIEFPVPGGVTTCADSRIQTSWVLTQNNQSVQCAAGDEVDLRVDSDATIYTFPCSDHTGLTTLIKGGVSHDVSLALYDATNHLLSQTPVMPLFVPCGTTQQTPQVEFSLTP
jgi:hypothetical protein